jgi:hypothetical protein
MSADLGTVTTLSQLMTPASGSPSATPTPTSERMPRMVRVSGAQVTADNTSIAASRVSTHTGRRPAGTPRSAQKISPRATTPGPSRPPNEPHFGRPLDPAEVAGTHPAKRGRRGGVLRRPRRPVRRAGAVPSGSSPVQRPGGRAERPGRRPIAPAPAVVPSTIWYHIWSSRLQRGGTSPWALGQWAIGHGDTVVVPAGRVHRIPPMCRRHRRH